MTRCRFDNQRIHARVARRESSSERLASSSCRSNKRATRVDGRAVKEAADLLRRFFFELSSRKSRLDLYAHAVREIKVIEGEPLPDWAEPEGRSSVKGMRMKLFSCYYPSSQR